MSSDEKYRIIATKRASKDVVNYVFASLKELEIEIPGKEALRAENLVYMGLLDGFCFESTEAMAIFFDKAYVVRGHFTLDGKKYYHAWIEILYEGQLYVFDPTANIICLKKDFDDIFKPYLQASISASIIRSALMDVLNSEGKSYIPEFDDETNVEVKKFGDFLASMGVDHGKSVPYSSDLASPFYHNKSAYKGIIEDNKIKSLRAHFYSDLA